MSAGRRWCALGDDGSELEVVVDPRGVAVLVRWIHGPREGESGTLEDWETLFRPMVEGRFDADAMADIDAAVEDARQRAALEDDAIP